MKKGGSIFKWNGLPAGAPRLQSLPPVRRGAELGAFG